MPFTAHSAKTMVIGATAGATILSSVANIANGNPPNIRAAIGGMIAGTLLYAIAGVAPALAGGFAMLLLAGAVLTNGSDVARVVGNATGKR